MLVKVSSGIKQHGEWGWEGSDNKRVLYGVGRLPCWHCLQNILYSVLHFGLLQFSVERAVFVSKVTSRSGGLQDQPMFRKEDQH